MKKMPEWTEEEKREMKARKYARAVAYIVSMKLRPCVDCKEVFNPCAMDFDHVRGRKFKSVSQMKGVSLSRIKAEIRKCEVVCANCHRIRTCKRRGHAHGIELGEFEGWNDLGGE